jgi:hypothetical protein
MTAQTTHSDPPHEAHSDIGRFNVVAVTTIMGMTTAASASPNTGTQNQRRSGERQCHVREAACARGTAVRCYVLR